jgi:hypothetical protein
MLIWRDWRKGIDAAAGGNDMLRLSEQKKQEIVRFIEADKKLSEKYRFLLFGNGTMTIVVVSL